MLSIFKKHIEMCSQRSFLEKMYHLREKETHLLATIAVNSFDKAIQSIERAYLNQDFVVDNMFEAMLLALNSLDEGEQYWAISAIVDPDHWLHDEYLLKYTELSYRKIKDGVIIKRIFIVQNKKQADVMKDIMTEQAKNGIEVYIALEDELKNISFFPDFVILPEKNSAFYVPNINKLMQCYATNNQKVVTNIKKDFEAIRERAKPWTAE